MAGRDDRGEITEAPPDSPETSDMLESNHSGDSIATVSDGGAVPAAPPLIASESTGRGAGSLSEEPGSWGASWRGTDKQGSATEGSGSDKQGSLTPRSLTPKEGSGSDKEADEDAHKDDANGNAADTNAKADDDDEDEKINNSQMTGDSIFEDEDSDDGYGYMDSAGQECSSAMTEIQERTFEEIKLPDAVVAEIVSSWSLFLAAMSSREAAAEALYSAFYEAAPSLQPLFRTPRGVMAVRILNGIISVVVSLDQPKALKTAVETLGFQHMDLEVTAARVTMFRDAVIDLLEMELNGHMSSRARLGWSSILNYIGGAYIYVRTHYSERLKIIASSWVVASVRQKSSLRRGRAKARFPTAVLNPSKTRMAAELADESQLDGDTGGRQISADTGSQDGEEGSKDGSKDGSKSRKDGNGKISKSHQAEALPSRTTRKMVDLLEDAENPSSKKKTNEVPGEFFGMFRFNAAVMGFGSSPWMDEILGSFDTIVRNVGNPGRLQEECDTLALRLSKYTGTINLAEFKAVMLASLRSLVSEVWDQSHEVAWIWLWENVDRMLKALAGKPRQQEKALGRFIITLTEEKQNFLRSELYRRFFALAPGGQDYFKQSTTRLYWLVDKVLEMTIELYRDPKMMANEISAVGLRHVGYGIPTELFGPYVSGFVEVVRSMTDDTEIQEAFRWSLSLLGRIMVRTIDEGSTVVMKAINTNSAKQLRKAVQCAPRGVRAMWCLDVTVGAQSISPLYWAIESSSLEAADAMLRDLLVIRADREKYYYGVDDLFGRHPDIMYRLCQDAVSLLPTLLDGLIWRSRISVEGQRRVNYYVKHLIVDAEGNFSNNLAWLVSAEDPLLVCHPAVVIFSDLLWDGLARSYFVMTRCWFLSTLVVFIVCQSYLQHLPEDANNELSRYAMCACRIFIYVGNLGQLMKAQVKHLMTDCKQNHFVSIAAGSLRIPRYLTYWKEACGFLLMIALMIMCSQDPIFHCLQNHSSEMLFTRKCAEASLQRNIYSKASMIAMILYWILCIDLTVLSTRVSAFVLICGRVVSEVGLFLFTFAFFIATCATSVCARGRAIEAFENIPESALSFFEIAMHMFPLPSLHAKEQDGLLMIFVVLFILMVVVFLLSLLAVQLNGAYQAIYADMMGYARLNRGKVLCETMKSVSKKRWHRFLDGLKLDERLEFNEGDIGLAGGIQVREHSNLHPTAKDAIIRFGGSTSAEMVWPQEENVIDEENKFDRLERFLLKAAKTLGGNGKDGKGSRQSSSGGSQRTKGDGRSAVSTVLGGGNDSEGSGGSE